MIVTTVIVKVREENVNDFIEASVKNHEQSVKEPGNMRFDILQSEEEPTSFILYEAYESKEHAAAHKNTQHYLAWRDTVAGFMAEPRKGIPYQAVRP